jgi:hypothetical protein
LAAVHQLDDADLATHKARQSGENVTDQNLYLASQLRLPRLQAAYQGLRSVTERLQPKTGRRPHPILRHEHIVEAAVVTKELPRRADGRLRQEHLGQKANSCLIAADSRCLHPEVRDDARHGRLTDVVEPSHIGTGFATVYYAFSNLAALGRI